MAGATLGTAYVQIRPTAQGITGSITNAIAPEAQAAGTAAGNTIGAFAKKAIAAAAIGAAVVKGIQAAMSEGAKLQQSYFGGVDTLYEGAADSVRAYAREAAQAGISMNDYSEQAVSFGAALKQAYGGDVTKAAQAANTAILDMADNSAKMGTDIHSVQDAYQGFAKQNYTMLDNLKLGYGGTKTEMERLLADAEKLSGQEYSIDNLGDVYEAIHVIQEDLGLTGVAAEEASQTFSGSFNAMKAAALNALGSLAVGENIVPAMQQLATSVSTFIFNNFIPMLGTIIKGLPSAIVAFLKVGIPSLLNGVSSLVSTIATNVKSLADNLTGEKVAEWATTAIPKFLASAAKLIGSFASGLITNIPKILSALGKITLAIVTGLGAPLVAKVKGAALSIVNAFASVLDGIKTKVKSIIDKVKSFFPFSVGRIMKNIKLPHFKLSGEFSLKNKTVPKLSVDWYAKGGIVNSPTIFGGIGMGEKGAEAILPLKPFWDKMDQIAESNNVVINVYASEGMSVTQLADEVQRRIIQTQNRRKMAWQ